MPKRTLLLALTLAVLSSALAQEAPKAVLERGIGLFESERYREALELFGSLLADPKAREERPEAAYWSALAYIAAGEEAAAERSIDAFLSSYPADPRAPDLLYQRGRLLYGRSQFEASLGSFASFMAASPSHELYPSALYWSGECLYALGRLEEAERAFSGLLAAYPKSVKVEAASYRRALIGLERREEELLKLLTWSHEESLRIVEDFRRRERAYEQAISVYQKQISDLRRGAPTEPERELAELRAQVAELSRKLGGAEADLAAARSEIAALREAGERERSAVQAAPSGPAPGAAGAPDSQALAAEALAAKARALDLLAFYLERISGASSK